MKKIILLSTLLTLGLNCDAQASVWQTTKDTATNASNYLVTKAKDTGYDLSNAYKTARAGEYKKALGHLKLAAKDAAIPAATLAGLYIACKTPSWVSSLKTHRKNFILKTKHEAFCKKRNCVTKDTWGHNVNPGDNYKDFCHPNWNTKGISNTGTQFVNKLKEAYNSLPQEQQRGLTSNKSYEQNLKILGGARAVDGTYDHTICNKNNQNNPFCKHAIEWEGKSFYGEYNPDYLIENLKQKTNTPVKFSMQEAKQSYIQLLDHLHKPASKTVNNIYAIVRSYPEFHDWIRNLSSTNRANLKTELNNMRENLKTCSMLGKSLS